MTFLLQLLHADHHYNTIQYNVIYQSWAAKVNGIKYQSGHLDFCIQFIMILH